MTEYSLLTDASLASVGERCRELSNMDDIFDIKDAGIVGLTQGCGHLQSIIIKVCYKLTGASLASIGERCRELTSIDISFNSTMIDVGIASLTKGCSHLLRIIIQYCNQLTDSSLAAIGERCMELISIYMYWYRKSNSGMLPFTFNHY